MRDHGRCGGGEPRNTLSERSEGAEAVGRVLKGRPSGRECTVRCCGLNHGIHGMHGSGVG